METDWYNNGEQKDTAGQGVKFVTEQSREHVNPFLTLFIGKDIHKPTGDGRTVYEHAVERFTCTCGKSYGHKKSLQTHIQRNNPNFFTPNDFARLRKWMEKNEPELWSRYLRTIYRDIILHSALLNSLPVLLCLISEDKEEDK